MQPHPDAYRDARPPSVPRDPRFPDSGQQRRIRWTLRLAGLACIGIGLAWMVCYTLLDRLDLVAVYLLLVAVGIYALANVRRASPRAVPVLAHAMLLLVGAMALIDVPQAGIPRSVHLYFLPLAAATLLVAGDDARYLGRIFPVLCLVCFVLFGARVIGSDLAVYSPPANIRFITSIANHVLATMLLAVVVLIYRLDINTRLSRARELARALPRGEITVLYQPQVDHTGRVTGAEALVRWQHPTRGLLTPDRFIPLAERSLLIGAIGLDVIRQACTQLRAWADDPELRHLVLAVNVSPLQLFDPGFPAQVKRVLEDTGANPHRLELELTESALSGDPHATRTAMWALRNIGIRWALDDFGTGYSSLSLLRSLPIQKIKIDRHFVVDAAQSDSARRLLEKIVEIPGVLGMSVIAEGIEDAAQRDMLEAMGCRAYQGFLFGRPQRAEDVAELARRSQESPSLG